MSDIRDILLIISTTSGWLLVGFFVFLAVFKIENLIILGSNISKLLRVFGTQFKKKSIANKVRGTVLKATKAVCKDCVGLISPYDLKVEFVANKDKVTFLADNQVIVRMSDTRNAQKNLFWAMNEYIKKGIVPHARIYMPNNLLRATDLVMMKKMLEVSDKSVLPAFYDELINVFKYDRRMSALFDDLVRVDNNGLFTRVYLKEIAKMSLKILGQQPTEDIRDELRDFASFLISVATRQPGEPTRLNFYREHIKIALILAARDFSKSTIDSTTETVINLFNRGCETIYILAIGCKIEMARDIARNIEKNCEFVSYTKYYYYAFRSNIAPYTLHAVCIEVNIQPDDKYVVA